MLYDAPTPEWLANHMWLAYGAMAALGIGILGFLWWKIEIID